jgi:hypothetical protein
MDLIHHRRHFLDLVQDHPTPRGNGTKLTVKERWLAFESQCLGRIEQIVPDGVGEMLLEPS